MASTAGRGSAMPVVVGIGDVRNRSQKPEDAIEPLVLMLQAIALAADDASSLSASAATAAAAEKLQASIDSVDVVGCWTWPYADLPTLVAAGLGVEASALRHSFYSPHGGNQPARMFDEAARRIARGETKVAVITGGEALASLSACAAAKKLPPPGWTKVDQNIESVFSPTTRELPDDLGGIHSIGSPITVYPLYENGFRAYRHQSPQQNNQESAELYAEFAAVAEKNPFAWNYGMPTETAESIGTVSRRNRMICTPYPLLMNAFNTVNLAAACLLTSTEYATELGIPESRWIYPLGGAGTRDSNNFWDRPNFYSSPSISYSIDAALEISGLTKDQIDLFDFYSCFPIVPKIACHHLGLPITHSPKPITLLGGLTSFGGAGNNYSLHALTAMVRALRQEGQVEGMARTRPRYGLVLANGGVLTYQHAICLSSRPRADLSPYPANNPLPDVITDNNVPAPPVTTRAHGPATIETYTVEFARDGHPLRAHVVGRLRASGHRFVANHADTATLARLAQPASAAGELIGRSGWVRVEDEGGEAAAVEQEQGVAGGAIGSEGERQRRARRNLFSFNPPGGKL